MKIVRPNIEVCCHDMVQTVEDNSINLWGELCKEFSSHFIARRKQPKTVATLNTILQENKETLREYVERFTPTTQE